MRFSSLLTCATLLACLTQTATAEAPAQPQKLQTIQLGAGMYNIKAQLALTPEQRRIGLMHRESMGTNEGMLFVFERKNVQCFWMKNTLIPLQTAFVADDGTIVNLAEMKPHSTDNHCSTQPVRYVLEMNTGWFTKRNLAPGAKLRGQPFDKP